MKITTASRIVPGFPYEGALFWFFSNRETSDYNGKHPYYLTLYGPNHNELVPRATALAALFEDIVFAPADAPLPDYQTCIKGDTYENMDLRIQMSWSDNEWDYRDTANRILQSHDINSLICSVPLFAKDKRLSEHFVCRTLLQIRLADKSSSILIGNSFYHAVCERIFSYLGKAIQSASESEDSPWVLDPKTLDLFGLYLPSSNIDSFASIRQSKQISNYSKEFRKATHASMKEADTKEHLLKLMKKAMDQDEIRKQASGAFQAVGSGANIGGLIPFVGSIASALGITSDVASRALDASSEQKQWYLVGPKMQQIALSDMLKRIPNKANSGDAKSRAPD